MVEIELLGCYRDNLIEINTYFVYSIENVLITQHLDKCTNWIFKSLRFKRIQDFHYKSFIILL